MDNTKDKSRELFKRIFKKEPEKVIKSPYRICPIGAHVDHQGGLSTGFTIDKGIILAFRKRKNVINLKSNEFNNYCKIDLKKFKANKDKNHSWDKYITGAVIELSKKYKIEYGFDGYVYGEFPVLGGLSSSAAVTTAYLKALAYVNDIELTKKELLKMSHGVENNYIGLKNGILDQSINIFGEKDKLTFINCNIIEEQLKHDNDKPITAYRNIENKSTNYSWLIFYSGLSKPLIRTDYNKRVVECFIACKELSKLCKKKAQKLCDLDYNFYLEFKNRLNQKSAKRGCHYYHENLIVEKAISYWKNGSAKKFGVAMNNSCYSSIENYECGSPELILLHNILLRTDGVYGSRFSGGGHRGCCIALVNKNEKENIKLSVMRLYTGVYEEYKYIADVYECKMDDGIRYI